MTDFNKLASGLDEIPHSHACREAARILRAAAGADVEGLMAQIDAFASPWHPEREIARAEIESALRVAMAPKPGFVMVPIEPTEAMLNAANAAETKHVIQDRRQNGGNDPQLGWGAAYRAMIAASQAGAAQEPAAPKTEPGCTCEACMPQGNPFKGEPMRMIVCATCGNKRCPHATDHRNACTNSNEPGQPGSSYPKRAEQEPAK